MGAVGMVVTMMLKPGICASPGARARRPVEGVYRAGLGRFAQRLGEVWGGQNEKKLKLRKRVYVCGQRPYVANQPGWPPPSLARADQPVRLV